MAEVEWHVEVGAGGSFAMASAEDSLLRGALRAGLSWPYECSVGGCGACRFELLDGEVVDLWPQAPGLSERERQRGKRLACQSRVASDLRVRVRLDAMHVPATLPSRFEARLVSVRRLTHNLAEFVFACAGRATFAPGQYALLYLPGVAGARAYSMSNLPNADGLWQFIVKRVPGGSGGAALFDRLRPGASIDIDAPYGHASLRNSAGRDLICIAGGSGIGPMLSIARGALALADQRRVLLFVGLRSQQDLGCLAALNGLHDERLTVTTVLSDPLAEPHWQGAAGFVHEAVERLAPAPLGHFEIYLAGPSPMIEAAQAMLMVRHKIRPDQVHFDRFC